MRFDKKRVGHWLTLIVSTLNAFFCGLLRRMRVLKRKDIVVFYGHALNGNLKAFYDYLESDGTFTPVYATMFKEYHTLLRSQGYRVLFCLSFRDTLKIASCSAIITDHGAHFLHPAYKNSGIKFIDVWHGIAYKGWDEANFGEIRDYDEVWVSSDELAQIYKQKYVFKNKIVATGYARTDPLVNKQYSKERLIKKYDLPRGFKKLILVAPTWKQDDQDRSIVPFGETIQSFFKKLDAIGSATNSLVIFRAHLNSGDSVSGKPLRHVRVMPYAHYPVAEEFLGAADLLVTDWSSIAFDFLAMKLPVVYLDVDAPFEKGFTLDASYRFGPVVGSLDSLEESCRKYVSKPDNYRQDYKKAIDHAMKTAYGDLADGKASERYFKRLKLLVAKEG